MIDKGNLKSNNPSIPNWRLALYLFIFTGACGLVGYLTNENPWKFAGFGVVLFIIAGTTLFVFLIAINNPTIEKFIIISTKILTWALAVIMPFWLYIIITRAIEKAF